MIQLAEFRRIQCRMDLGKKTTRCDLRLSQRRDGHSMAGLTTGAGTIKKKKQLTSNCHEKPSSLTPKILDDNVFYVFSMCFPCVFHVFSMCVSMCFPFHNGHFPSNLQPKSNLFFISSLRLFPERHPPGGGSVSS